MLGVVKSPWRKDPKPALLAHCSKLLFTDITTAGTNKAARVEPVIVKEAHINLLTGVKAGKCVVENIEVEATFFTDVLVTPGAPVLPLSYLTTALLLPHPLSVIETLRLDTISL